MRISDWSSDVCSADLARRGARPSGSRSPADRRRPGRCAAPRAPTARQDGLRSWSCRHHPWNWPPTLSSCASSGPTKRSARVHRPGDGRDRTASTPARGGRLSSPGEPTARGGVLEGGRSRSEEHTEEHTSELQSLMRISYAVFCLKKKNEKHKSAMK